MTDDGRNITLYLNDHYDEFGDPIAMSCAEWELMNEDRFMVIRWFPDDEQVEVIPTSRLLSVIGIFEGFELGDER